MALRTRLADRPRILNRRVKKYRARPLNVKQDMKERRARQYLQRRIIEGMCLVCDGRSSRNNLCKEHQGVFRNKPWKRMRATSVQNRRLILLRRKQGLCSACYNPAITNLLLCERHHLNAMGVEALGKTGMGSALKEKLLRQGNQCYYTGRELKIGINASLDHVKPYATHWHLRSDLNNVVWCDFSVNMMKSHLSMEDFIAQCRLVAARFPEK